MRILAIDPGYNRLGWAVGSDTTENSLDSDIVIAVGLMSRKKARGVKSDWRVCWLTLIKEIERLVLRHNVDEIVIEEPELFITSGKGQAASNSGAVLKLMALVYGVTGYFYAQGVRVKPVLVRVWKGNLPKDVTRLRVIRHWPQLKDKKLALDTWDALGLLLWRIKLDARELSR